MPDTNKCWRQSCRRLYTRGKEAEKSVDAYQNEGATKGIPTKNDHFLHIQLHSMHEFISFSKMRKCISQLQLLRRLLGQPGM